MTAKKSFMDKFNEWGRWFNNETAWGRFARKHRKGLFITLFIELVIISLLLVIYHQTVIHIHKH